MSLRFPLALIAAVVGLGGCTVLHRHQKWTTYHDAQGWSIEVPGSFHRYALDPQGHAIIFSSESLRKAPAEIDSKALVVGIEELFAPAASVDSRFPLDPGKLAPASGGRVLLTFVHHRHSFVLRIKMRGSRWQDTAYRMVRSLRF
jgi:hypothetical protein